MEGKRLTNQEDNYAYYLDVIDFGAKVVNFALWWDLYFNSTNTN